MSYFKLIAIVCLTLKSLSTAAAANAPKADELTAAYNFEQFKAHFHKAYPEKKEHEMRKRLFEENLKEVIHHNSLGKSWKEGMNHMSDWTREEIASLLGLDKKRVYSERAGEIRGERRKSPVNPNPNGEIPESVDWRERKVVSPVKDQGQCGSCWSFAAAETVESHLAISTKEMAILSEQQILDCTVNKDDCGGTGGCSGGTAELAWQTIEKIGGLASEWTYPYTSYFGKNNKNCGFNASTTRPVAKIHGFSKLPSNELDPLMEAIATQGPISISVEAVHWAKYESGVFDGCNQTNPDIDHAVQLVGYGKDPTLGDYWLVRNSWSPTWGEEGYIRVRRTSSEGTRCGTDITPSDGSGCENGPKEVKVCGTCAILFDNCYPSVGQA